MKLRILEGLFTFCICAGVLPLAFTHVSLTFPPARQFPLDFLNTFWTKQPCGMPKGNIRTSLVAGRTFNVTWHLGYAHQGGYRIELLDSRDNKLMDLTPTSDNDFYQGRTTAQWHVIELPDNVTCSGCTIRLLRQVPEFSPNFQFISCSDVDIVRREDYSESCSSHGYAISGKCTCYARYWGDRCQFQDECDTDLDCNGHGKCIYLGGSALPRKQCFCSEGYFGITCTRQNPSTMPNSNNLDLSKHVRVKLEDRITMYFKILLGSSQFQDEIEFVLKINGTSYAGLGWRPNALGPICKSWPFYPDALYVDNKHHSISKRSSTFTITKSIDQSQSFGNQNSQISSINSNSYVSTGRKASSGISSSDIVTTYEDIPQQVQVQQSVVQNTPQKQPQSVRNEVISVEQSKKPAIIPVQEIRNVPQNVPSSPSSPQPQQQPDLSSQTPSFTPAEWAAKDPFTPMDCTDIIMGAARGNYHRIRDTYARGRHTPLVDSIWGGRDDLTGATGWEQGGVTTLVFRRRMDSSDGPDHSIRGDMLVIWARGQQPGERVISPQHQLETGNPIVSNFYTEDEPKYHGLGPQRGLLYIDFTAVRKEFVNGQYSS